jgi:hypothetical protein
MKLIATTIALIATCVSLQAQLVQTVPTYDENSINTNVPDLFNTSPAYGSVVGAIAAGFTTNKSGVVNFDPAQSIPVTSYPHIGISALNARYGAGAINTMQLSFGNPVNVQLTNGPQIPISGKGLLRQPIAAPLVFKLSPSNALPNKYVGFTVLQQQNAQKIKVEFIQAGGPTIVANSTVPVAAIPTKDVFIGRKATVAGGIVAVRITVTIPGTVVNQKFAIDDLTFRQ